MLATLSSIGHNNGLGSMVLHNMIQVTAQFSAGPAPASVVSTEMAATA